METAVAVVVVQSEEPEDEDELPEPPPTEDILAERANGSLMARWAHETRARLVMEFIKERHLYQDLNTYLRKRIR